MFVSLTWWKSDVFIFRINLHQLMEKDFDILTFEKKSFPAITPKILLSNFDNILPLLAGEQDLQELAAVVYRFYEVHSKENLFAEWVVDQELKSLGILLKIYWSF